MAAMTIGLTELADFGNSITYAISTAVAGGGAVYTALEPRLVIQKRKSPTANQILVQDEMHVLYSTENAAGDLLPQKVSFKVLVSRPKDGLSTDVDGALASFRDIVAGDEFEALVDNQYKIT